MKRKPTVAKQTTVIDAFVGKRIRAHRVTLGISQTELAQRLGITFQQVQKYEKGTNRVGAGRLFDLAGIFDVPVQALFPEKNGVPAVGSDQNHDLRSASLFLESSEGCRLFRAFLKITDAKVRKQFVALAEQVSETNSEQPIAGQDQALSRRSTSDTGKTQPAQRT